MGNPQEDYALLNKIRQNEELVRALFQSLPDLVLLISESGHFLDTLTDKHASSYVPREEFLGKHISEVLPPVIVKKALFYLDQTLTTGKLSKFEYDLFEEQELRHFECRTIKVAEKEVLFIIRNITESQTILRQLSESKKLVQDITRSIPQTIFLFEMETMELVFTNRHHQFLGYEATELRDINAFALACLPTADFERLSAEFIKWYTHDPAAAPAVFEFQAEAKNGHLHWLSLQCSVFTSHPNGTIKQFLGVATDITEQKQAVEKLRESEAQYRVLVENAFTSIAFYDLEENRIAYVNDRIMEMLGRDRETLLQANPVDLSPSIQPSGQRSKDLMHAYLQRLQAGESSVRFDWVCQKQDGTLVDADSTLSLVHYRGKPHLIFILTDIEERKASEQLLVEKENKYRSIFESSSDGIAIVDIKKWQLIDCNEAIIDLLGLPKSAVIDKTIQDFSPEYQSNGTSSHARCATFSERTLHTHQALHSHWRFMRPDTSLFDTEMTLTPIKDDPNGYWLAIFRDISLRQQQEIELERSKDLYRAIAHNLPDSNVMIFDHNLRYLLTEGAGLASQGFSKEMMEGKTLFDVLQPEYAQRHAEQYRSVLAGAELKQEDRYNGRIYDTRMLPLKDADGKIYAGMILSQDVTEKRQLAEAIETVSNQINVPSGELFFNELAKGLAMIFQVGHILISRYEPEQEEVIPEAYWAEGTIIENFRYKVQNAPCEDVLAGSSRIYPNNVQHYFPYDEDLVRFGIQSYAGVPLYDSQKKVVGLISLLDQSPMKDPDRILQILQVFTARAGAELERQKATRALQASIAEISDKNRELEKYIASNVELERFAYVASHDLREPLRNISGFAQLLEKRYVSQLDDTAKEYIGFITQAVRTMNQFIQDLLNYSRITSMESRFQEIATQHIIDQVHENLSQTIETTQAEIHWESLPQSLVISEAKILQVLQNLLSNALKFRQPDLTPIIRISAEESPKEFLFRIQDNGIGIDSTYFEKIFMPFRKLYPPDQYKGSGIGLAICKRIIEQHGGKIWLESTFGKGSTFFFTLRKNPQELTSIFP